MYIIHIYIYIYIYIYICILRTWSGSPPESHHQCLSQLCAEAVVKAP